jgi:hypothetical protein
MIWATAAEPEPTARNYMMTFKIQKPENSSDVRHFLIHIFFQLLHFTDIN